MEQQHHTANRQASLTPQKDVVLQHSLGEVGFPTGLDFEVEEVVLGVSEVEEAVGEALDGGEGGVEFFGFDGRGEAELGGEGGEPVLGAVFEQDAGHRVILAGHLTFSAVGWASPACCRGHGPGFVLPPQV
jgi:hypothetical protein